MSNPMKTGLVERVQVTMENGRTNEQNGGGVRVSAIGHWCHLHQA